MDERVKQHRWHIEPREYARQEARRGRRHAYASLVPARTALVVIDMVPFFSLENRYCRGIVPNINLLAGALRAARGTVAWILPAPAGSSPHAEEFHGSAVGAMFAASGGTGPLAGRLAPGLAVVADANAARRDRDHNATLHTIYRTFGDVRPTAEVLIMIEAAS